MGFISYASLHQHRISPTLIKLVRFESYDDHQDYRDEVSLYPIFKIDEQTETSMQNLFKSYIVNTCRGVEVELINCNVF